MSSDIKIFENSDFGSVRIVMRDGEPWFVAKDVAEILEIQNIRQNLADLDDDEKGVCSIDTPGGAQEMLIISESGLYLQILRSRKPEAKPFRRWITHDVVPSIRKTGGYGTPALSREDILSQALQIIGHENEALNRQIEILAPKADFADAISEAEGGVSVNRFAKILCQHGIKDMGANRLYKELRKDGFTIHRRGKNWNAPKQKYVDKGYFRIVEYLTDEDDSIQCITTGFFITGRGQQVLLAHFKDKYGVGRQLSLFNRGTNRRNNVIPMKKKAG